MREVHFVTRAGCGMCEDILKHVVAPLERLYPEHVKAHHGWDADMERINRRKRITHVPLFVVEHDGEEEFRFCGRIGLNEVEDIVLCEAEVLTLDDALGVVP